MVSPAVMGTGTVSNVSAKSVSRNSCSGSGSDFKKVMAASLAQNTAGAGKNPADNKLSVPIAEKSDAQTAKSSSQDVNAVDAGSNNKAQSVNGADKNELNDKVNEADIESNNGGRGFARNVETLLLQKFNSNRCIINTFYQSKNKQSRILSNSTWVMNHIYFPVNWADRFPDYYDSMIRYQKEGKNAHDDAQDATTGIAEKIGQGDRFSFD